MKRRKKAARHYKVRPNSGDITFKVKGRRYYPEFYGTDVINEKLKPLYKVSIKDFDLTLLYLVAAKLKEKGLDGEVRRHRSLRGEVSYLFTQKALTLFEIEMNSEEVRR